MTPAKSKAESVATAINSLLSKLSRGADLELALVGYRGDSGGAVDVGSRWGGAFDGRVFVNVSELAASPLAVEQRTRKVPGPSGLLQDQTVDFPIWYRPTLGEKAPQIAAFEHCRQLLADWAERVTSPAAVPLVVNITAGLSADGNPLRAVESVLKFQLRDGGYSMVMQAHLGSSDIVPPTLFPANRAYLKPGPMWDLFDRASLLSAPLVAALRAADVAVVPKARAMIYNARMPDLVRLLGLIQTHAKGVVAAAPPSAPKSPPTPVTTPVRPVVPIKGSPLKTPVTDWNVTADEPALVFFMLDRSVSDPFGGNVKNACARLQEYLGDLVEQIVKTGEGCIDVGVISYGVDGMGQSEVRACLEGGLYGRPFARDNELLAGAVRVDKFTEEISNGVGGLLKIPHERPMLVEVEPTSAASAAPAFIELARVMSDWRAGHPSSSMPPILLHLTRGKLAAADMESGVDHLRTSCPSVVVYHLVATESEHAGVQYPSEDSAIQDPDLQCLWRLSSPLLCADQLAGEKPGITSQSRGMVVNAKFGLLLDAIKRVRNR